ncbi:MAG: 4Fe-4S dicluster domain-containing protein [SAR202 cluster bacterium]|nr:4Fe-4S dicluster domain-containing protein [SAR202 cluster bacterium]
MPRYGMVIDLERCVGCRACMEACKVENNTPQGAFWMYVFRLEQGEFPDTQMQFVPRPCQHCDNAPCVKACPVGARYKREEGMTVTDWDRYIGCRDCEVACPYGVNYFNYKSPKKNPYWDWKDPDVAAITGGASPGYDNPDLDEKWGTEKRHIAGGGHAKGIMEKCTFCVHRVEQGLKPACVANCPAFALKFGDLDDPQSDVSHLLRNRRSFRLEEGMNTQPRVHYFETPPKEPAREIERPKTKV